MGFFQNFRSHAEKQENWFSLWIPVANPFWQLEMLPTCSPWQRPEWPPAAIGVFGLEVVFLFFPRTFKETLQHYMNLIRNLQNDPENSEKSALRHFFTSSSNFWCIAVCGSSSAKRRTASSLAEKIAQKVVKWKTSIIIIHDQQHITLTTSWPFFSGSHTHANQRNPCPLISCCNVWIPCSNGNWDVERLTMPTNHFNPSFDSIGPR